MDLEKQYFSDHQMILEYDRLEYYINALLSHLEKHTVQSIKTYQSDGANIADMFISGTSHLKALNIFSYMRFKFIRYRNKCPYNTS